jgi:hypothetical protein
VLGLVIATALGLADAPSILLAVALAFFSGYGLPMLPLLRAGIAFGSALGLALVADTLSIVVMEVVNNAIMMLIPGAMDAGLADALFWGSLAVALAVAFTITLAVKYFLMRRGRGHAVVHRIHMAHENQPEEHNQPSQHARRP